MNKGAVQHGGGSFRSTPTGDARNGKPVVRWNNTGTCTSADVACQDSSHAHGMDAFLWTHDCWTMSGHAVAEKERRRL